MVKSIIKFFDSVMYLHGYQDGYTVYKLENLILLDRIKMLESQIQNKDKNETK